MNENRIKAKLEPYNEEVLKSVTLQGCRARACTRAIESEMQLSDYVMTYGHSLAVAQKHYWRYSEKHKERRRKAMSVTDFSSAMKKDVMKGKGKSGTLNRHTKMKIKS